MRSIFLIVPLILIGAIFYFYTRELALLEKCSQLGGVLVRGKVDFVCVVSSSTLIIR